MFSGDIVKSMVRLPWGRFGKRYAAVVRRISIYQ